MATKEKTHAKEVAKETYLEDLPNLAAIPIWSDSKPNYAGLMGAHRNRGCSGGLVLVGVAVGG